MPPRPIARASNIPPAVHIDGQVTFVQTGVRGLISSGASCRAISPDTSPVPERRMYWLNTSK